MAQSLYHRFESIASYFKDFCFGLRFQNIKIHDSQSEYKSTCLRFFLLKFNLLKKRK